MASESPDHGTARRWQYRHSHGMPGDASTSSKGRKLFFLLAGVLALAGAIIGLLLFLRPTPEPFFLTISVGEYESKAWPANPFAYNDGKRLIRHFPPDSKDMFNSQIRNRIITELNRLPNDQSRNIVLHLSALAVVKNDDVFLLPADATPDETNWLSLRTVLSTLAANESPNKLLILDITHPLTVPKLGIMENDAATQVQTVLNDLTKKDKLTLRVLTACSSHQESLDIEAMGMSAFGYFLDRGLEGHADGSGPTGEEEGKITVDELAHYAMKQVDRWAAAARNTRQTPMLIGEGEDFILINRSGEADEKKDKLEKRKYPAWLAQGWALRDEWLEEGKHLASSRPFGHLEYTLMRAEERWLGGINEKEIKEGLEYDVAELKQLVDLSEQLPEPVVHSVALVSGKQAEPSKQADENPKDATGAEDSKKPEDAEKQSLPDPGKTFGNLVAQWESGALKKEDWPKKRPEIWKSLQGVAYPEVVSSLSRYLLNQGLPKKHEVKLAHELLKEKHPNPLFVEEFMLQQLDELRAFVEDQQWSWTQGGAVFQVLRTFHQSNKAIAALYDAPFALPWVEKQFETADKKRQKGERILFGDRIKPWSDATSFLKQAEQDYGLIQSNIQTIKQAKHTLADALRLLPAMAKYYSHKPDFAADEKRGWLQAVNQTIQLADLLKEPIPAKIKSIRVARTVLFDQLDGLLNQLEQARQSALQSELPTADTYLQLRALLTYSELKRDRRIDLWNAISRLDRKLLSLSATAADANRISQSSLANKRHKRLHLSTFLNVHQLRLTGLAVPKHLAAYKSGSPDGDSEWGQVERELRSFWQKRLPEQYGTLQEDLPAAVRLSYSFVPYRDEENWRTQRPDWSHNPSAVLARNRAEKLLRWLGTRYQQEHEARVIWAPKSTYYAKIAAEYPR